MKYYICMDSGGTTTNTYALDECGEVLQHYQNGVGSFAVSREAIKNIEDAIYYIYQKMEGASLASISLGLSGIGAIPSVDEFKKALENKYQVPVFIYSDAHIALRTITDTEGIVLVAGTGNACLGFKHGVYHLTGGGGPLLDERGSAYSFMQRATMMMKEHFESGLTYTELDLAILKIMNLSSFSEVKTFIYNHSKAEVAHITELIFLEKKNNKKIIPEINALIMEQAIELVNQVKLQYAFFKFENQPVLGLLGGFFKDNELLKEEIEKELKKEGLNLQIIENVEKTYLGALKIAKEGMHE